MTPVRVRNRTYDLSRSPGFLLGVVGCGAGVGVVIGLVVGVLKLLDGKEPREALLVYPLGVICLCVLFPLALILGTRTYLFFSCTHWIEVGNRCTYRTWRGTHSVGWDRVSLFQFVYRIEYWRDDEGPDEAYVLRVSFEVLLADGRTISVPASWDEPHTRGGLVRVLLEACSTGSDESRIGALRALGRCAADRGPSWKRRRSDSDELASTGERAVVLGKADVEGTRAALANAVEQLTALGNNESESQEIRAAAADTATRLRGSLGEV